MLTLNTRYLAICTESRANEIWYPGSVMIDFLDTKFLAQIGCMHE